MSDPVPPFFSVIIPAYNRAATLGAALASVRGQTCQDFEIIVVDDGSQDDPRAVVEAIGDPRIRFLRQENEGGGAARNAALDAARGRFIAPLDSDDLFLPHHLEAMKNLLADTSGVAGYARILVDRGAGRTFMKPPRAIRPGEDMGEYLLCRRGFMPTITLVVEREMARRVRYHVNLRAAEDTDFAIRLALAGCKFRMIERAGAVWKDLPDPNRTSAGGPASHLRAQRFATWLKQMKPLMTRKAWYGARGWAYAKMVAKDRRPFLALVYYLGALIRGCYSPAMAAIILLQIVLNAGQYRAIADLAIAWMQIGLRDPQHSAKKSLKNA